MRKLCKILKEEDVGSIGIGAMIVFIAMVLVAGIAASVLVQTANTLEIQAMNTGEETTSEVSTGIAVFDIEGHVNKTSTGATKSNSVNWLTISIKPRAGSNDIDLKTTVIELSNGAKKTLLSYNSSNSTYIFNTTVNSWNGQIFSSYTMGWGNLSKEDFGILVLSDADSSISASTPVINRGDAVMLCMNCTNIFPDTTDGLKTRDNVWGQVIPEEGSFGVFSFRVPSSLSDTVYDLY